MKKRALEGKAEREVWRSIFSQVGGKLVLVVLVVLVYSERSIDL